MSDASERFSYLFFDSPNTLIAVLSGSLRQDNLTTFETFQAKLLERDLSRGPLILNFHNVFEINRLAFPAICGLQDRLREKRVRFKFCSIRAEALEQIKETHGLDPEVLADNLQQALLLLAFRPLVVFPKRDVA